MLLYCQSFLLNQHDLCASHAELKGTSGSNCRGSLAYFSISKVSQVLNRSSGFAMQKTLQKFQKSIRLHLPLGTDHFHWFQLWVFFCGRSACLSAYSLHAMPYYSEWCHYVSVLCYCLFFIVLYWVLFIGQRFSKGLLINSGLNYLPN